MSNLSLPNLSVQIGQGCNLACEHCGFQEHYRRSTNDRPLFMSVSFFDEIIEQYRLLGQDKPKYLSLSAGGEPLVHPAFFDLCVSADRAGINFGIDTNATLLNADMAMAMLSLPHFKRIVFSIDGARPETYEAIRKGANFERVHTNVLGFLKLAQSMERRDLHTRVNMVLQERNQDEADSFIRYWAPKVSQVNVSSLRVGTKLINPRFMPQERTPCRFLWEHSRVLTDGSVVICCVDDKFTSVIGDLRDNGLAEIWRGTEYEKIRERHLKGDFSDPEICKHCDSWAGFLPARSSRLSLPCTVISERPANLVAVNLPIGSRAFFRYVARRLFTKGQA